MKRFDLVITRLVLKNVFETLRHIASLPYENCNSIAIVVTQDPMKHLSTVHKATLGKLRLFKKAEAPDTTLEIVGD
jgi:hypothetical protein